MVKIKKYLIGMMPGKRTRFSSKGGEHSVFTWQEEWKRRV